jgi:hypothetical protein
METRGRKPTYNDPKVLRTKVDEYFESCHEDRVFPDYAAMRIFLKLSKQDIADLCDEEINGDKAYDYREIFDYARDRRESALVRRMVTDPKSAAGCKAALAMPENGGYSDKAAENQDRKITIKMSEEDAELFK